MKPAFFEDWMPKTFCDIFCIFLIGMLIYAAGYAIGRDTFPDRNYIDEKIKAIEIHLDNIENRLDLYGDILKNFKLVPDTMEE